MTIDDYIESLLDSSAAVLQKSISSWRAGIDYELQFWSSWFESGGREWPEDFRRRTSLQPLAPWLVNLLPAACKKPVYILDVGAGPITATGSTVAGREVVFTAVDPLAHHYNRMISQNNLSFPVISQCAFAEDLSARFDLKTFDLICCTNSLDHSIEPLWGIIEMLQVLKLEGVIHLGHRQNEAEFEKYSGFHQWNFDAESNDFIIWKQDRRHNISKMLTGVAEVTCDLKSDFLSVTMTKSSDFMIDTLKYNRRLRAAVLEALIL